MIRTVFGGLALLCAASTGSFAQTYPGKPVTIVSPYSAGGNADLAARSIAVTAAKTLGQPVVVINRPGPGGTGPPPSSARRRPLGGSGPYQ